MASDKRLRGFAGLDAMVSEIDLTPLPSSIEEPAQPASKDTTPAVSGLVYNGVPGASSEFWTHAKWWLVAMGVAAFFSFARSPSHPSLERQGILANSPTTPAAASVPAIPSGSVASSTSLTPNEEHVPPIGSEVIHDRYQIRYCLSEKIRVTTWFEHVNKYSKTSVDRFNAAVSDFNARCANFRYRRGALESVRAEVEANRGVLIAEGLKKAARKP